MAFAPRDRPRSCRGPGRQIPNRSQPMTARQDIPRIVGVIASLEDLRRAVRLRRPPDFFELRLDALVRHLDQIEAAHFPARLILTARHPREGGANKLATRARRDLLLRFLPRAHAIDIELRSAPAFSFHSRIRRASKIFSASFRFTISKTPRPFSACARKTRAAQKFGADIFKVATCTDTGAQLNRLIDFYDSARMPVAAMGLGRLGKTARRELMRRGSIAQLRSPRRRRHRRPAVAFGHSPLDVGSVKLPKASSAPDLIAVAGKGRRGCRVPARRAAHPGRARARRR